jgi:hypothetical protein
LMRRRWLESASIILKIIVRGGTCMSRKGKKNSD